MEFEVVTENLNFPEGPVVCDDGSVLVCEIAAGRVTRVTQDGRHQVVAKTGGGPNGMAVGPDGALYCCNNGGVDWDNVDREALQFGPAKEYTGGFIQRVDVSSGRVETIFRDFDGRTFGGLNDIVFAPDGTFWFSDYGKWTPDGMRHGGLYHASIDGSMLRRITYGLSLNGVGVSLDGKTLYAAATHERWILAFDTDPKAGRQFGKVIANVPGRQFFDSMALEADGTIAVGCLTENHGIARINPNNGHVETIHTPDPLTTNIAFGGPDMQTAYITFTQRGALVKCRWPKPGFRLPFNL